MQLEDASPQTRLKVLQTLRAWLRNPDLTNLRDAAAMSRLLEAEQEACRQLWFDVQKTVDRSVGAPLREMSKPMDS